jgi:hypothetical protein
MIEMINLLGLQVMIKNNKIFQASIGYQLIKIKKTDANSMRNADRKI